MWEGMPHVSLPQTAPLNISHTNMSVCVRQSVYIWMQVPTCTCRNIGGSGNTAPYSLQGMNLVADTDKKGYSDHSTGWVEWPRIQSWGLGYTPGPTVEEVMPELKREGRGEGEVGEGGCRCGCAASKCVLGWIAVRSHHQQCGFAGDERGLQHAGPA